MSITRQEMLGGNKIIDMLDRHKGKLGLGALLAGLAMYKYNNPGKTFSNRPTTYASTDFMSNFDDLATKPISIRGRGRRTKKSTRKSTNKHSAQFKRGALVSKLMRTKGLSLGEASKYIKMHNLM